MSEATATLPVREVRLTAMLTGLQDRLVQIRRERLMSRQTPGSACSSADQILERLEDATMRELAAVEHALERIASGRGSECEACGEAIESAELVLRPTRTQCRNCATRADDTTTASTAGYVVR